MDSLVLSTDAAGKAILWNLTTRSQVTTFSDGVGALRGTALILGSRDDGREHVDGFVTCQSTRSFVHMYSITKVSLRYLTQLQSTYDDDAFAGPTSF